MRRKIILYTVLSSIVMLVVYFLVGYFVTRDENRWLGENTLRNYAAIYAENYTLGDELGEYDNSVRITIIDKTGAVLKDSKQLNVDGLENHLLREEVQAALAGKPAIYVRHSASLGVDMMYYALKVEKAGDYYFVRVALTTASINKYVYTILPILIGVLILMVALSVVFSSFISKNFLKSFSTVRDSLISINEGRPVKIMPTAKYDEVNTMLVEINDISAKVESNLAAVKTESAKLGYVIDNVNEGIFVIDGSKNLYLINHAAQSIFSCARDVVGCNMDILTADEQLTSYINKSFESKSTYTFEMAQNELSYLVTVKYLDKSAPEANELAIVVMQDVTAVINNEKMRSEFFANASHELKTPLTAIKGFGDLLKMSNEDKKLNRFIEQISVESDRMLRLIEDMLNLSQLETAEVGEKTEIEISDIANEVVKSLEMEAKEKKVNVTVSGKGKALISARHLYEVVRNLTENAVKYNVPGGEVKINVTRAEGNKTKLTVEDTGIGIELKDQQRVFERFYRVQKSRSRSTGGTGLGLSIVKHICNLYNAKLSIRSKVGAGTKITVVFSEITKSL